MGSLVILRKCHECIAKMTVKKWLHASDTMSRAVRIGIYARGL